MEQSGDRPSGELSPIARALGEDFRRLHPVVRRHYLKPAVDANGVMDTVHVNPLVSHAFVGQCYFDGYDHPKYDDVGVYMREH